ncbi:MULTISPECIES: enoyl-CoA hydratase/isomerase family protein [unclassified Hwanghaeella]|jgi:enoyl-CoA hydratase/carnithine racemase|uniref:enoyl-CoA hydratase/isomerase family protein n=1 Tax=unclassified Hwanghaeella TaxID=2605944 RepID=UPI000C625A91|nr:enoyl-CoA hydratase [Rhodospirillales bacterium]MAX64827.1 enoyl-CoA hydratase [Rhodospirillaceae bacterium]MBB59211.1 enoyl-CoA hydratase [Rhodospirillaceae bacterium]HAE03256.1 enoyl-CoA hydratase [Rhodospirillaceae bacterium]|tara:strand:- start:1952 stop:2737 length:786 start_codon:yes stop_codon:yes gene_type:complete
MMGADEPILFRSHNGIARITVNRPQQRNAINIAAANRLTELWDLIDDDDSIRCVILDAVPCGTFCAGMDLKQMAEYRSGGDDILTHMTDPFQMRMRTVTKPIVAALVGHFVGAGLLLAMHADIRIAFREALASIPEVRHGRGTSWMVPMLWMIPQPILAEMALTGAPVTSTVLAQYGFINHVCDSIENVTRRADQIATVIANNAPLSVRAAKATLAAGMDLGCAEGLARAEALHVPVYKSNDAKEGPRAFVEGRPPVWTGT